MKNLMLTKDSEELHSIPVKAELWNQVEMDLICPLVEASCGNIYIIIATEHFSKWDEAGALPNIQQLE